MKKSKKLILLTSASLLSIGSSLGIGLYLSKDNLETNLIEDSTPSSLESNNDENRFYIFQGTTLTRQAVIDLGWDQKNIITYPDWAAFAPNVTQIGISNGGISDALFSNARFTLMQVPAQIKVISDFAFYGVSTVQEFVFHADSQLESIGASAFQRTGIRKLFIPDSVVSIGSNAFAQTNSLNGDQISMTYKLTEGLSTPLYGLSQQQWNSIVKRRFFAGDVLTQDAINILGWNRQKEITKKDWISAPNVKQISPPAVVGGNGSTSPFYKNTFLKSIYIPSKITDINFGTFWNVRTLETVTIGENSQLNNIRGYAFANTSIRTINIPNTVTLLGEYSFESATLLDAIKFLPNSKLNSIGANAFQNTALTEIDIPNSVSSIGANVFASTTSLLGSRVSIHNKFKRGSTPLYGFTSQQWVDIIWKDLVTGSILTRAAVATLGWDKKSKITLTDWRSAPNITQIGPNIGAEIENSLFFDNMILQSIEIPSRIQIIGNLSFWGAQKLTKMTFEPNSNLKSIGELAFLQSSLEAIEIPKSVVTIQKQGFFFLSSLKSITFEENSTLTTIGELAFQGAGITSINIPNSVTSIGALAFANTNFLAGNQISMPAKLRQNSSAALYGFTQEQWDNTLWRGLFEGTILTKQAVEMLGWNRKTSITLTDWQSAPNVVQLGDPSITTGPGNDAPFSNNTVLQSIIIPAKVTSINFASFYKTSALKSVTFEEGSQLSTINSYSFRQTTITGIKIPSTVTTIGEWAFESNASLRSITFESGSAIKTIGARAFQNSGITAINLPDSVTTIGDNAFNQTTSLNGNQVFMSINLKASSVSPLYGFTQGQWNTINWRTFQFSGKILTKEAVVSLGWDTAATITLEDWKNLAPNVIQIGSNDQAGNWPFLGNTRLQAIFIPNSIALIANSAFSGTTSLRTITFENNSKLNLIGSSAFQDSGISSINIPDSVTTIGLNAFTRTNALIGNQVFMAIGLKASSAFPLYGFSQSQWDVISWKVAQFEGRVLTKSDAIKLGWDSQRTVTIDDWERLAPNVVHLGDSRNIDSAPFSNNLILQSIEIPSRITQINSFAFYNTKSLKTVVFERGSKLITINNAAFKESGITLFEIPTEVVSIGQSAFEATRSLSTITFAQNSGLKAIEDFAFVQSGITAITIPNSVTNIGKNTFSQTIKLKGNQVRMLLKLKADSVAPLYGFSDEQWNSIDWIRAQFTGDVLTKEAVVSLGWDTQKTITLDDWSKWAPNVSQLGTNDAGAGPFLNNTILQSIDIPNYVTAIGDFAFRGATSLVSIVFQNNSELTAIGNQAFLLTSALQRINLEVNSKLKTIGTSAFQQSGITAITIPSSVTTINNNAFSQTSKLVGNQISMEIKLKNNSVAPLYGFSLEQWNAIDWRKTPFIGQILTKEAVNSLDWNTEEVITIEDFAKWAPNVTQIGTNTRAIQDSPFANNTILKSIQIPEKITLISDDAFTNTSALVDIQLSYLLFAGGNSSEPQFGLKQSQWNSASWTNVPKQNVPINSIIARHLLKSDSVITWDEISPYISIQANAFSNTNITSIRIQWKEDFVIGDNAFFNTPFLTNIELSDRYQSGIPNYGFSQNQIRDLILIDQSPIDIATIITASVLGVVMIALIATGGILFSKYTKNKHDSSLEEDAIHNYESEHYYEDNEYYDQDAEYYDEENVYYDKNLGYE